MNPPRVYIAHVVSFDTSGWPNTSVAENHSLKTWNLYLNTRGHSAGWLS